MLATDHILDFNRRPTVPLGILSHLPITLGGKTVCIDVMVVQGPLDLNIILGQYYVYAMKFVMFAVFRVMHFPHDGNIVTIDQLSFVKIYLRITTSNQNSLNVMHVLVVPSPSSIMSLEYGNHVEVQ